MAYYPYAPAISDIYTLTGVDGTIAVFNDSTSPNFVGAVTEVTGLDSAEVRESSEDLTESDGGAHGNFYYGRRPIVLSGKIYGHETIADRAIKIDKIMRASNAMRGDATLSWKPADWATRTHVEMMTPVRRQQPLRITGAWVKDFQLSLVSEYAQLFSVESRNSGVLLGSTTSSLENRGSGESYPNFAVSQSTGSAVNPYIRNLSYPTEYLYTTGLTLAAGETIFIDGLNHTAVFNGGARAGQSANRYIDFAASSNWPRLHRGNNNIQVIGASNIVVYWRDTWV